MSFRGRQIAVVALASMTSLAPQSAGGARIFHTCSFSKPVDVTLKTSQISWNSREMISPEEKLKIKEFGAFRSGNSPLWLAVVTNKSGQEHLVEAEFATGLSRKDIAEIFNDKGDKREGVNCLNPKNTSLERLWQKYNSNPQNQLPMVFCSSASAPLVQVRPDEIEKMNSNLPKTAPRLTPDCKFKVIGKKITMQRFSSLLPMNDEVRDSKGSLDGDLVTIACNQTEIDVPISKLAPDFASVILKQVFHCQTPSPTVEPFDSPQDNRGPARPKIAI